MTTLIYTPGLSVVIESHSQGLIDVSDDVSNGSLSLRENALHTVSLTLENAQSKYDGVFAPNDRISIQLKRFKWLQVFTGYLDTVPYFSAYPRPISLSASCTMKVLKNFPWDRGSSKAFQLIHGERDRTQGDGGMADVIVKLFTEVMAWPAERVHIGKVPTTWQDKFTEVYAAVTADRLAAEGILGTNPILAGGVAGAGNVTGPTAGVEVSDAYIEGLQFSPADVPVVLATIRGIETGGNYTTQIRTASASGAYAFVDAAWGGYGGYAHAWQAPASVQDAKATEHVMNLYNKGAGAKLILLPANWYCGHTPRDSAEWDSIPRPDAGNRLTIRAYAYKWARKYVELYLQMNPTGTGVTGVGPVTTPGITITQPTSTYWSGAGTASASTVWPIPPGLRALSYSECGWGGYSNGNIPATAMAYTRRTGSGHPEAVKAYTELLAAADAKGFDLKGSFYRSAAAQATVGAMGAPVGQSNHGWGLAIDIDCLVGGNPMFSKPEYLWLKDNAHRWGFGHPYHAEPDGSKPEAWHWEFFAIYSIMGLEYTQRAANDNSRSGGGVSRPRATATMTGSTGATANGVDATTGNLAMSGTSLFAQMYAAIAQWEGSWSAERDIQSDILQGHRALMNDEPMLETISKLISVAGRNYCAAPNGDFIAWWPDYWGEYGLAGILELQTIELVDFTVEWSDATMVTHQYVEGSFRPANAGPTPSGIMNSIQQHLTGGIATVAMPGLLAAIINAPEGAGAEWLRDPVLLLQRMGARISRISNPQIFGPQQEFWVAVQKLTRAWASMFTARIPMTFMPELFPGMILRIPDFGVQFYVSEVSHSFNVGSNGGFTTSASVMAPSSLSGSGFYLLPKGGHVFRRGGTSSPRNPPL